MRTVQSTPLARGVDHILLLSTIRNLKTQDVTSKLEIIFYDEFTNNFRCVLKDLEDFSCETYLDVQRKFEIRGFKLLEKCNFSPVYNL